MTHPLIRSQGVVVELLVADITSFTSIVDGGEAEYVALWIKLSDRSGCNNDLSLRHN